MILNIMTLNIMTLNIRTLSIMKLNMVTLGIMIQNKPALITRILIILTLSLLPLMQNATQCNNV